ncbi:MAG TPA: sugar transferase [Terracidiphilus sp.]|jgi:exopolysaccharide biosynthesis polyprenyl glycosylphosphotransferase
MDAFTILVSVVLATLYKVQKDPLTTARGFWHGTLIHNRPMGTLLALLCFFAVSLIFTSRRLNLYTPTRLINIFHEQRLSAQACLTSGLMLAGLLYMVKAEDISRFIVLVTVGLVTVGLGLRRLVYRMLLYRSFERGIGTRNVLIVGTGPEAIALRFYLESIRHLGYRFMGFIEAPAPGRLSDADSRFTVNPSDIVGSFDTLFQNVRAKFVDEIFFTTACERGVVTDVLEQARVIGVDLRMVPDMYEGLTVNSPIEYIGYFPTIPLHTGHVHELRLLLKRGFDVIFSSIILILFSPLLLAVAIAIKLDSPGPVFYISNRIGKKGRIFRCFKFRTMVSDAEKQRSGLLHRNERDGLLFKISDDPRITKLGRFLRKYSLDEFPQFFNVLRGDMSVVGPRPPIDSEVREYKLNHLRRLDVAPGITGLWQVQARQDPSFDSYISLDVTYIENMSVWLDIQLILRTIGVVMAGTGT